MRKLYVRLERHVDGRVAIVAARLDRSVRMGMPASYIAIPPLALLMDTTNLTLNMIPIRDERSGLVVRIRTRSAEACDDDIVVTLIAEECAARLNPATLPSDESNKRVSCVHIDPYRHVHSGQSG